jgi:hypothetical protein
MNSIEGETSEKPSPEQVAEALAILQNSDIEHLNISIHRRPTVEGMAMKEGLFGAQLLQSEPDPALARLESKQDEIIDLLKSLPQRMLDLTPHSFGRAF